MGLIVNLICVYCNFSYARMAELVDALGSGSSGSTPVQVRVLLRAQVRLQNI